MALVHPRAGDVGGVEHKIHRIAAGALDAGHEVHHVCERVVGEVDPRLVVHRVRVPLRDFRAHKVWRFDREARRAIASLGPFDIVHGFGKTSCHDVYSDGSGVAPEPGWLASPHRRVVARIERARFSPGGSRRVLAISKLVREQIRARYGVAERDIELHYPGVDLARFRPRSDAERQTLRERFELPTTAPVIAFVGSEYRRKGLATLLDALASLPDAVALIAGRSSEEEASWHAEEARRLGVAGRCRFLGARSDPEALLGVADVFAFPSRFDAFGRAVLEAMACGVPVVVSRASGASELVSPGVEGEVLDDPHDASALAAALSRYFDPTLRAQVGGAARKQAEAHPWQRHVERVLEVYAELSSSR